jgi:hypothetical protein
VRVEWGDLGRDTPEELAELETATPPALPEEWGRLFAAARSLFDGVPFWVRLGLTAAIGWTESLVARDPAAARDTMIRTMRHMATALEVSAAELYAPDLPAVPAEDDPAA